MSHACSCTRGGRTARRKRTPSPAEHPRCSMRLFSGTRSRGLEIRASGRVGVKSTDRGSCAPKRGSVPPESTTGRVDAA
eukprot:9161179-Pyramimonas_sp.AAC.1